MPLLQDLKIESGRICGDDYSDFRSMLDAIRNQSKGMKIRLAVIWNTTQIHIDHHKSDFEHLWEEKKHESDFENVNRNLRLYLSGKVDWNPSWLDKPRVSIGSWAMTFPIM